MDKESMRKHSPTSIPIGMLSGVILTLINTALAYNIWMI
jgi:hypothetical protein